MRRRIAFALLAAAAAAPAAAQPAQSMRFGSGGTVAEAAGAFRDICMAHPGDATAQRAAALALKPKPFRRADGSPDGVESFTLYFTQLSLLETPGGQVCAVLSPMFDPPAPDAALADTQRRLHLGKPLVSGEQRIWPRKIDTRPQTIAYTYHTQPDAMGKPRQTVQLTLIAPKVR
jgi:hypothetical protein